MICIQANIDFNWLNHFICPRFLTIVRSFFLFFEISFIFLLDIPSFIDESFGFSLFVSKIGLASGSVLFKKCHELFVFGQFKSIKVGLNIKFFDSSGIKEDILCSQLFWLNDGVDHVRRKLLGSYKFVHLLLCFKLSLFEAFDAIEKSGAVVFRNFTISSLKLCLLNFFFISSTFGRVHHVLLQCCLIYSLLDI